MPQEKRNAPHILAYIMEIDKDIRNGEYPNTNTMNKKHGWNISRSTIGRYIDILRDTYNAPVEYDFKKNGYYYSKRRRAFDILHDSSFVGTIQKHAAGRVVQKHNEKTFGDAARQHQR